MKTQMGRYYEHGYETGWEGMSWIHLAHDRDQWRALVNKAKSLSHTKGEKCIDQLGKHMVRGQSVYWLKYQPYSNLGTRRTFN
jgi:hypothetical protein